MKLLYSFLKDMKLASKSFYFYMELGIALIFVVVLLFIVPENPDPKMDVYAYIDLQGPYKTMTEEALSRENTDLIMLNSREEVKAELKGNRGSVGLVITQADDRIVYEYILQGYEGEKFRNILKTSTEAGFVSEAANYRSVTNVITLEEDTEKLSLRLNILPVFLAYNAAFMGLFIIAAYIFLDKEEGTIKAFAVTPARVWHYLLGKVGVILVSGLMSGLVATIFLAGLKANYLHLILLLIATNAFGSTVGLFIASFFNTMVKAMGWLYVIIIILSFSAVSYYLPAFSPLIIRILPSYPMLFAFRETLYDVGNTGYIYTNVLGFSAASVILFLLANYRFKKTLTV
ncbi:MAG: ABC transporter permease [Spirochaetales bacterium]|nr:ABC transporter permease [Spirochaetales bacterium]